MVGGTGKDNLYGGGGNDVFKLTAGSGYDRIRDFEKGRDRVDLRDFDINKLEVLNSGKNLKIYNINQEQSDLMAIIYNFEDFEITDFIFWK